MRLVALVLVVAACAAPRPPGELVAGPIQKHPAPRARRVKLSFNDALGEAVRLGGQERATVVFFISRESGDESKEFITKADEALIQVPVDMVGVVDVRRYHNRFMRSIVERKLRGSEKDGRAHRRQRREERHADLSHANAWHLAGDFDGTVYNAFGVEPEPEHPIAYVVLPSGAVYGPYRELAPLVAAARRAVSGSAPANTALKGPSSAWRAPRYAASATAGARCASRKRQPIFSRVVRSGSKTTTREVDRLSSARRSVRRSGTRESGEDTITSSASSARSV